MPLPPYIKYEKEKEQYYQTFFAEEIGSAAAPTASLHFTPELVKQLNDKKVRSLEKQIAKAKTAEEKKALEVLMKQRMSDVIKSKAEAGFVERTAGKAAKLGAKAGKWVKGHKWPSIGIAAGTVATGTALGYGVHKLKNRNKN